MDNDKTGLILTQHNSFLKGPSRPTAGSDSSKIEEELHQIKKQLSLLQDNISAGNAGASGGSDKGSGMERKAVQAFREELQVITEEVYLLVNDAKEVNKQRDKQRQRTNGLVILTCIVLLFVNVVIPAGLWLATRI